MRRIAFYAVCFVCAHAIQVAPLMAQSKNGGESAGVICSTSWVAAIAQAAGVENPRVLAPANLRHPPEYELKPSDLKAVSRAKVVLYAGWEMFAQKLTETAGGASIELVQVATPGSPDALIAEAEKLSRRFGTEARFLEWKQRYQTLCGGLREQVRAKWAGKGVVVQRMQKDLIVWLGLTISGEYGPAEPSPAVILELVNKKPALVVDNYHGPSGMPIAEAARAPYAELINFPGKGGTKTLDDVFRYNMDALLKAR
jgi:hypothetical protein